MRRRRILAATGTALTIGTAGCSGILGDDGDSATEGPEAVAEAYIRARTAGDAERVRELQHPESLLRGVSSGGTDAEVTDLETEIEDEELMASEVGDYEEAGIAVDGGTVGNVQSTGEVKLVRAQAEIDVEGETVQQEYLVVAGTDDGEWLVLGFGVVPDDGNA